MQIRFAFPHPARLSANTRYVIIVIDRGHLSLSRVVCHQNGFVSKLAAELTNERGALNYDISIMKMLLGHTKAQRQQRALQAIRIERRRVLHLIIGSGYLDLGRETEKI